MEELYEDESLFYLLTIISSVSASRRASTKRISIKMIVSGNCCWIKGLSHETHETNIKLGWVKCK